MQSTGNDLSRTEGDGRAPRLRLAEVYIVPLGKDTVQIRGVQKASSMRGAVVEKIFPLLLPLLDGTRSEGEIVAELSERVEDRRIRDVLATLVQKGLVVEDELAPAELFPEGSLEHYETLARYFGQTKSRYGAIRALRCANIAVFRSTSVMPSLVASLVHLGVGSIHMVGDERVTPLDVQQSRFYSPADVGAPRVDILAERLPLAKAGVKLRATAQAPANPDEWRSCLRDTTLAVVLLDGPILFYPWIEELNSAALELSVPWTTAALLNTNPIHIGPTFIPGTTACYKCYEKRFKSNLSQLDSYEAFERYVQQRSEGAKDFGQLPPVGEMVGSILAMEIVRQIDPAQVPLTAGRLMTFEPTDFSTEFHPVLKLPRCSACSPTAHSPAVRIWG